MASTNLSADFGADLAGAMPAAEGMSAMVHSGLPGAWGLAVLACMVLISGWVLFVRPHGASSVRYLNLAAVPWIGSAIAIATTRPAILVAAKIVFAALFLLIIAAGLYGTPIAGRNAATVLTWNIWWTGLFIAVFFLGSAWCGVCPWDTLATWLVKRRLWKASDSSTSLNLRVPGPLRSVWPALVLLLGFTWLELGVGVTVNPYYTALLALLMVVLATVFLALFQRKAICRYLCPVGRTVGSYAQLAVAELRPVDASICAGCTSLACYYGNDQVDPCPTHQVMGRMTQNTYCTSCGNCARSCPAENIAWHLRSGSAGAIRDARPHWDEAWFMLGLLALTSFHGLSMVPFWAGWIGELARLIGDSGRLLTSFTVGFVAGVAAPVIFYASMVWLTQRLGDAVIAFRTLFTSLSLVSLPLAFAYHISHNLNHLLRESGGLMALLANPFGEGAMPLSQIELHMRQSQPMIPEQLLFALQSAIMLWGYWVAVRVLRHRGRGLTDHGGGLAGGQLFAMLFFVAAMTAFHLWLLARGMVMRL